ncbi:MAG: transglycosylase SLT domain-containing protein [Chitinivibrionales bacterium]|nr:transglycosylase SLT domain-containing protein [Chitinivibrionales bacterium]
MTKRGARRRFRLGLVIHGSKLWVAEPLTYMFVGAFLIVLSVLTGMIIRNQTVIHRNRLTISRLKINRLEKQYVKDELAEKNRIYATLDRFTSGRLSPDVYRQLVELVYHNSKSFGYDPLLVLAVIHVESVFDPRALGRYRSGALSGAFGLMQLKLETAREVAADLGMKSLEKKDLFDPEINIVLGIAYLTRVIARFKSLKLGILAYNQGPGVIQETLASRKPLSIRYYEKVLRSYYMLQETANDTSVDSL